MSSSRSLRSEELDTEQRKGLEIISRSGSHLLGLLNDVLEMAKLEAGHLATMSEVFELPTLLEDVALLFQGRATHRGLKILRQFEATLPPWVQDAVAGRGVATGSSAARIRHEGA